MLDRPRRPRLLLPVLAGLALAAALPALRAAGDAHLPNLIAFPNPTGEARTFSSAGALDLGNPFFRPLGTNGRACATCHVPMDGWTIVPDHVQARFDATGGLDPIFQPFDGANAPSLDVSTVDARRTAYSLLLKRGVIRIDLPVPPDAEFILAAVDDPYRYATSGHVSLYRRPLPTTNLGFLSTVLWDGRDMLPGQTIAANLAHQASVSAMVHDQPTSPPTADQLAAIVAFEGSLDTAQTKDVDAGELQAAGALGGPVFLSDQPFRAGSGHDAFTLFGAWAGATGRWGNARQAVARGERLFNRRVFGLENITCSTCHNAENAGSSTEAFFVDLGLTVEARRSPDVPLYLFLCETGEYAGRFFVTMDPGRALVTGKCADMNRFKVPTLRGLATRAPYFHDGSAPTLSAVVDFYNAAFGIGLAAADRADLVAFLETL